MTGTRKLLSAGSAAIAIAMSIATMTAQAPEPFKRIPIQRGDLSAPGREVVQAMAEIQPGAAAGRHTHPGEEVGYVIAGPVVLEIDGQPAKTLQTGEGFIVPAGQIHNATNRGSGVAKILATYIVAKGKPTATPVQ